MINKGKEELSEDFNLDANLDNADWMKKSWDLPPYGSPEFFRTLRSLGISLKHFMTLPVYKHMVRNKKRIKEIVS